MSELNYYQIGKSIVIIICLNNYNDWDNNGSAELYLHAVKPSCFSDQRVLSGRPAAHHCSTVSTPLPTTHHY